MTKQHFEEAARIVKFDSDHLTLTERTLIAHAFAALFATFNPRFDRARFYSACGL